MGSISMVKVVGDRSSNCAGASRWCALIQFNDNPLRTRLTFRLDATHPLLVLLNYLCTSVALALAILPRIILLTLISNLMLSNDSVFY